MAIPVDSVEKDPSESMKLWKLNTVKYTNAPASYLAIRCLKKLSESAKNTFPRAGKVMGLDFNAGFELIKWFSISAEVTASKRTVNDVFKFEIDASVMGTYCVTRWRRKGDCIINLVYRTIVFNGAGK